VSTSERFVVPELAKPPGYAHAIVTRGGRLVHCAGACPIDEHGVVVEGGISTQTLQCLANLRAQLAAAGAAFTDVVQARVYVASSVRSDLVNAWRVVEETPVGAAACTLLGVALLGFEGQLVEIEVTAVVAD
jgi:enamine deaminase RidA (YjgF/YER057c/UK114 family)